MKRILSLILVAACAFTVCACDGGKSTGDQNSKQLKIVCDNLTEESYAIGVDKDKQELLGQVNAFIEEIIDNGTLDEIENHYFGDGEPVKVTSAEIDEARDQLLVASTLDFEPFEYGKIGEYYGIDMEIIRELADYLGKDLVIVDSSFETMFMSVNQHKCDICIGGISITPERQELVDFSTPYFYTGQCLVVDENDTDFDDADTPEEIIEILNKKDKNTVIGVENLTTAQEFCEGAGDFEGFSMTVEGYRDISAALDGLIEGECDYVMADYASTKSVVDKLNGEE